MTAKPFQYEARLASQIDQRNVPAAERMPHVFRFMEFLGSSSGAFEKVSPSGLPDRQRDIHAVAELPGAAKIYIAFGMDASDRERHALVGRYLENPFVPEVHADKNGVVLEKNVPWVIVNGKAADWRRAERAQADGASPETFFDNTLAAENSILEEIIISLLAARGRLRHKDEIDSLDLCIRHFQKAQNRLVDEVRSAA